MGQEVLQHEHLKSINQFALANMRQMNQDGSHDQQEAAELLRGINAANSQFVLTKVALKTSWEAEPNGEEWERHENAFHHARSVLQTMIDSRPLKSRRPSNDSRARLVQTSGQTQKTRQLR
jgi:hypothetical protein